MGGQERSVGTGGDQNGDRDHRGSGEHWESETTFTRHDVIDIGARDTPVTKVARDNPIGRSRWHRLRGKTIFALVPRGVIAATTGDRAE